MLIYEQTYEALDNAKANNYAHEYHRRAIDIALEINDWSGIVGFDQNDSEHLSIVTDAVEDWRKDNPQ